MCSLNNQDYSTSDIVYLSVFISSFLVCISVQYSFDAVRNQASKYFLELIKGDQKFMKGRWHASVL